MTESAFAGGHAAAETRAGGPQPQLEGEADIVVGGHHHFLPFDAEMEAIILATDEELTEAPITDHGGAGVDQEPFVGQVDEDFESLGICLVQTERTVVSAHWTQLSRLSPPALMLLAPPLRGAVSGHDR